MSERPLQTSPDHHHAPRSVGILCFNAYPLFDQSVNALVGGMETRAALFGRGLAESGLWQVRFFVTDFGQPAHTAHAGIDFDIYQHLHRSASDNVNPRFATRKWFPVLNFDWRDLQMLWQIPLLALYRCFPALLFPPFWRHRRTDVVCCFGNNGISAQAIVDCRRAGIKTVLCLASDSDLSESYTPHDTALNDYNTPRWMAHFALETADHIFVQTENQRQLLASRFGRSGEVIRNPVRVSAEDPEKWRPGNARDIVLWIGRADSFNKRSMLFLELARRNPEITFLMIANRTRAGDYDALNTGCPPNLTVIERVPHHEIWDYYRRARVFVSTSSYEGFPNTFLQCAVSGVPVVSLEVDPEGIFSVRGCGVLAHGDCEVMEQAVRTLWSDHELAGRYAGTFHAYVLEYHNREKQVARFAEALQKVIGAPAHPALPWWHKPHRRFVRRTET